SVIKQASNSSSLGNPTIFIFLFQKDGPNIQVVVLFSDSPFALRISPQTSFPLCPRFSRSHPPLPSLFPFSFHSLPSLLTSMATSQADNYFSQPSQTQTVRAVIKGRVQGVFYRNWTIENGTQLGLKGWVRNRKDGSVEALFSGSPDSVQEMEQRCRRGPPAAMVTGLEVFPSNDDPGTGFEKKPTI
ncbi:hypothetical protein ES288_A09G178200v1, partial [Gossypium darwinii]